MFIRENQSDKTNEMAEDRLLWKQLLGNNRSALSSLFTKYYPHLLNYGLKIYPDEELVKDSIQEVFYTLWNKRRDLSDVDYVRSYLFASHRRTIIHLINQQTARAQRDRDYFEESFRRMVDPEAFRLYEEIKKEQREQFLHALESLAKTQKEVIYLKFYQGLSYDEIAGVMGVNKQSVYNYMHRALETLKNSVRDGDL